MDSLCCETSSTGLQLQLQHTPYNDQMETGSVYIALWIREHGVVQSDSIRRIYVEIFLNKDRVKRELHF